MCEVGVAALRGCASAIDAETTGDEATSAAAQAPPDAKQAVVTQPDAASDQVKAHEAGARCGAAT
jgi:hypothetical protein